MRRPGRRLGGAISWMVVVCATCPSLAGQATSPRPAVPVDPITAILDAFEAHDIVALGEGGHGHGEGHAFRLSLIHDPRFAATVDDIVIECGNARYQDVMDRFVSGEDVPDAMLHQVWRNTTIPTTACDQPTYEAFYRAVRVANPALPREHQFRVLLGDPPIDWERVKTPEDHFRWLLQRDSFPAETIRRDVLAKGRKALVIYGDMHLQRKQIVANYETDGVAATLVSLLVEGGASVFNIKTERAVDLRDLQADVATWPVPSLALTRGSVLGAADFTFYYPSGTRRFVVKDGLPDFSAPIPRNGWLALRMEDQFDAVLYLGAPVTTSTPDLPPALCADPDYMAMRRERLALVGPPGSLERLNAYCASQPLQ